MFFIAITIGYVVDSLRKKQRELKQAQAELKEQKNLLEGVIDGVSDILAIQKPDHTIERYNKAGYELLGMTPQEVKGKKCYQLLDKDSPCQLCATEKALKTKKLANIERYIPEWDIYLDCRSTPILDKNGNVVQIVEQLRDITEQKKTEKRLKEAKKLLEKLTEQVPGALYQYQYFPNGESCFPFASQGIYEVYEVTPEEVKDDASLIYSRIHADDYDRLISSILESKDSMEVWHNEHRVDLPEKGLRWLEGIARPEKQPDGSVLWHGYVRDITERKELEKDLVAAKEKAEKANRAKSKFLANMSHEIRTPLNAVIGFSEILENRVENPQQKSYLDSIQTAAQSLLSLINDILDLSKIEAGLLELEFEVMSLQAIFQEMEQIFLNEAEQKGLNLIIEYKTTVTHIEFDETRFRQILVNLIGNAIKFTKEGYVKVIAETERKHSEETLDLVVKVEDTGIGIAKEEQKKVFSSFTQHYGHNRGEYGGTGLGLAIVRKLTKLMGGEISLESNKGQGSTFELRFDGLKVVKKVELADKPSLQSIKFDLQKILIVDDVESNRELLKIKLENKGLEVIEAASGQEGVEKALEFNPELILMDIKMPEVDGYQAHELIRDKDLEMPIIALTAYATQEEKSKVKASGFEGFLTKPIEEQKLYAELTQYLNYSLVESKVEEIKEKEEIIDPQALIQSLEKEFSQRYKELKKVFVINDVEEFAQSLLELAQKHRATELIQYAQELKKDAENFDLDSLKKKFNSFPLQIERLKQDLKN
ncbi:ATP-binding protein [Fuchsiella alkaliacetigena]|uniref:ATP-binding protein n=1 Tax=Fuchsiella alkaliacetigena TaxID=957042 RepID=UPI00200B0C59|nr:ATP-binding protein [Fuchsiella alkaliacetigena]